jgi:hypothetical protein
MATQIPQIEKYIREMLATNDGSFEREAILAQSKGWMEMFPVEFNSVLNMIEAEGRNVGYDEMDDSTPSVAYGGYADDSTTSIAYGGYADDSVPSVAYGGYADDSTPSVAYGGYADDSTPSVAYGCYNNEPKITNIFGYKCADDSTPSFTPHHDEYSGNIASDHMSSVADSPMGSDQIDSSPGGYADDDFESCNLLQRTMSCAQPRR